MGPSIGQTGEPRKPKARYFKITMDLSKYTPSRLVYPLARETFLLDDLLLKHLLPRTWEVKAVLRSRKRKQEEIWQDFYATEAMTTESWKENQEIRHLVTRLAVHGFHTRECSNKKYHILDSTCVCELCGGQCGRYHLQMCAKRVKTLCEYSKDKM
jgi:hypothetical protein